MSDLFHELVPETFVGEVFLRMAVAAQHTYQVLTKRPERMAEMLPRVYRDLEVLGGEPLPHVWLGTSIENHRFVHRADSLRQTPSSLRFVSAEPLLGPVADQLDLTEIDWLIVGGESGPSHRPMRAEWVRDLRDRCVEEGVAFFFKQWGGRTPKAGGRALEGRTWDEMPALFQTGQLPLPA
jgi:protein gp37